MHTRCVAAAASGFKRRGPVEGEREGVGKRKRKEKKRKRERERKKRERGGGGELRSQHSTGL